MESNFYLELIGYFGSALVVFSMLMTSVVRLRIINSIGSFIFTGYAIAISSYPTAAMNSFLVLINIYNLYRLLKSKNEYSVVKLQPDESFVGYFLSSYEGDIAKFFPSIYKNEMYDLVYVIFCGSSSAGIFLGSTRPNGVINVKIDYTTPAYRDSSVGKYLYRYLTDQHFSSLIVDFAKENHKSYLLKMGFVQDGERFVKKLQLPK